jgi:hypothetical protein
MTTTATHHAHANIPEAVLFLAFDLSDNTWQLGFSIGHGQKPCERMLLSRGDHDGYRWVSARIDEMKRLVLPTG